MKLCRNHNFWKSAMPKIFFLIIVAAILFQPGGAISQEDMRNVGNHYFPVPQRSPAVFQHDTHNETAGIEECNVCHHVYDNDGNLLEDESSEDQSCIECHGLSDSGRQPGLRKAFHRNCKGCHIGQQKGPVMCGECHPNQR
jgi:hypothetical protein